MLKKVTEIEAYLFNETEVCQKLARMLKQFNTVTRVADTGLITPINITEEVFSIAAFVKGAAVWIALSGTNLLLSLAMAITRKSFKLFNMKQTKYDAIKLKAN